MSEPGKAVFLSYASQDAEAARRLAEAFRAAGVEVWFDQSELRGGDAWDQKIRRQIRECALFVPVISRHTQEREEGYFRLEWKLAEDRSHLMAKGRPFILPVSVDGTTERGALVPEAFLAVQWTRLLEGEIPAGLVRRVQQLLGEPGTGEPAAPAVAAPARPGAIAPRSGSRAWLIGAVLAFALAAVAYVALRPGVRGPAAAAVEAAGKTPAEARGATDKSIAVLPFANMSEDKDANAFFSDGIHEDILTNLAHIRELRVVSRTSVMEYRGTTKRIPQIARELHVAYVLEGSVRRAGTKIRVTGQLIRADTDEHVWAKSYDRDLTDVFAIQAELAQAIAAELDTALSPREQKLVESRPTENLAAYELLLKARAEHNARQPSNESVRMSFSVRENLLQSAIELDPNFALAWSELATLHVELIAASIDSSSARLAKAKAAVSQVQALAPESPAAIQALGSYLLFGLQEPGQAVEQFRKLVELQPNDSESQVWLAIALMAQGRWLDSIAAGRHSVELDPRNARARQGLITTLLLVRRYAEAKQETQALYQILGLETSDQFDFNFFEYLATGSSQGLEKMMMRQQQRGASAQELATGRKGLALARQDFDEFLRLDREVPGVNDSGGAMVTGATRAAMVMAFRGDHAAAANRLKVFIEQTQARLKLDPTNIHLLRHAALACAAVGRKEEARAYADQAVAARPESKDARAGAYSCVVRAIVLAWTGDKDQAIAELARLLRKPGMLWVPVMKWEPSYYPLHGDPRFEALLNDPKNNAPLF